MEQEHEEALASEISEQLGRVALEKLRSGEATAAEMRVALDYVKYHKVTDDANRPGSPVNSVADALKAPLPPFSSLDQELDD